MSRILTTAAAIVLIGFSAVAQHKTSYDDHSTGFIRVSGGMEYKIVEDAPGDSYPDYGDYIKANVLTSIGDSVLFNSAVVYSNRPIEMQLPEGDYLGAAFRKLTPGDSAIVRISVDSMLTAGAHEQPWMKRNAYLIYKVRLVAVESAEQKEKKEREQALVQKGIDDKRIIEYLKKHNIKAQSTASGIYYTIHRQGTGAKTKSGQKVSINYTGKLLNGQVFDSNVDPQFQHVQPFKFTLGEGSVIKGWDEGITLLNEGAKATLYIPSGMAYGPGAMSSDIPANSIMVFEVDLLDVIE